MWGWRREGKRVVWVWEMTSLFVGWDVDGWCEMHRCDLRRGWEEKSAEGYKEGFLGIRRDREAMESGREGNGRV